MRKSHPEEKGSKDISLPPQFLVTLAQRVTRCSVGAVQHPGFREPRATAETLLAQGGSSECPHPTTAAAAPLLPLHRCYRCLLSLQVNFVAAIDVYEDGEAGLLLCYNCKSARCLLMRKQPISQCGRMMTR